MHDVLISIFLNNYDIRLENHLLIRTITVYTVTLRNLHMAGKLKFELAGTGKN